MGVDLAVEGRAVPVTADARDIAQVAAAKQAAEASAFEPMTLAMATPGYGAPIATPAPERPNWPAAKGEGFDRIPAGAVEAATFVQPTPAYGAPELGGPVGDRPRLSPGGVAQALARRSASRCRWRKVGCRYLTRGRCSFPTPPRVGAWCGGWWIGCGAARGRASTPPTAVSCHRSTCPPAARRPKARGSLDPACAHQMPAPRLGVLRPPTRRGAVLFGELASALARALCSWPPSRCV